MLATEGTGRCAHRPPHAHSPACAWLLASRFQRGPAHNSPPIGFVSRRRSAAPLDGAGAWRVSRCVRALRPAPPPPRSKSPGRCARTHPSIDHRHHRFFYIAAATNSEQRPNTRLHAATCDHPLPLARSLHRRRSGGPWTTARAERAPGRSIEVVGLWDRRRSRHAADEHGAAGGRGGPAVGARDEPVAYDGRGVVGEGAGDRAAAGGDAGDAARPPRVRVRALAHGPRREGRRRRRRSRSCALGEDRGEGLGRRAVGVRRAAAGGGGGEARAEGVGAAARQRERRRGQLPQQQRRRPAQLLHAAVAHPELHRAAPHPDAVRLRLPEPQRRIRLEQEGEGPGRRDRQVLVVAVGSAVAQVQPAGPGGAAQRERFRHPHHVGRHPQSGQALRSAVQNLSRFFSSAARCVADFQLQLCAVRLCTYALRVM